MNKIEKIIKLIEEYDQEGFTIESGEYQRGLPGGDEFTYMIRQKSKNNDELYELFYIEERYEETSEYVGTLEEVLIVLLVYTYGHMCTDISIKRKNILEYENGFDITDLPMNYTSLLELLQMANIEEEYYSEEGRLIKDTLLMRYKEDGRLQIYSVIGDELRLEEAYKGEPDLMFFYNDFFLGACRIKNKKYFYKRLKEEDLDIEISEKLEKSIFW